MKGLYSNAEPIDLFYGIGGRNFKEMSNNKKSILLGNGFNMSLGINTSYKGLYENMCRKKFLEKNLPDRKELEKGNYELEIILGANEESETIQYHLFESIILACKKTISPHNKVITFLKDFDKFFTTNYDPLLYHNLMHVKHSAFKEDEEFLKNLESICEEKIQNFQIRDLSKTEIYSIASKILGKAKKKSEYMEFLKIIKHEERNLSINDGFTIKQSNKSKKKGREKYAAWNESNNSDQNIFYLHGSFHIYTSECRIRKYISNNRKVDFINKIQEHSSDSFSNLSCVFASKREEKESKIKNNPYLTYCLEKLSKLEGTLTIIGWSASENDKHLIKAINNSNLEKIIFYYHEKEPKNSFDEDKFNKENNTFETILNSKLEWVN